MKVYIGQIKPTLGNVEKNLNMMLEVIDRAITEKNDIVIFPELSLTGYSLEDIVFDVAIKEVPSILDKYNIWSCRIRRRGVSI